MYKLTNHQLTDKKLTDHKKLQNLTSQISHLKSILPIFETHANADYSYA